MKCEKCQRELAKNGIKKGVQYYYCTHCGKSYSNKKPKKLKHNIFEEYIAQLMNENCVEKKNEFTQTVWNINQVARLLGHQYRDVQKWSRKKAPPIDAQLIEYIESKNNGFDILCVLGIRTAENPSEFINEIITRKKRPKLQKKKWEKLFSISDLEYLRLVNMPITNRKEAIFVLGALLGCRTSEIVGVKYSDIDFDKKIIHFHRTVTFGKYFEISERNKLISNRKYPLTDRMIKVIKWLKEDNECNKNKLDKKFYKEYSDFLCIQENGYFINSNTLNKDTKDIREKCKIETEIPYIRQSKTDGNVYENVRKFQFKWLRYTVKLMMITAGVSENDIQNIFGYNNWSHNANDFEIMRKAYDLLDKYIEEKSNQVKNK